MQETWNRVLEMMKTSRGKRTGLDVGGQRRSPEREMDALGKHSMRLGAYQSLLNAQIETQHNSGSVTKETSTKRASCLIMDRVIRKGTCGPC